MDEPVWKLLTTLTDHPSALLLADGLSREGIAVRLVSDALLFGLAAPTRVYVESAKLHRARWLMTEQRVTDEELTFLSLGELPAKDP